MRKYSIGNRLFYHKLKQYIKEYGEDTTYIQLMIYMELNTTEEVRYHLKKLKKNNILNYRTETRLYIDMKE